MVVQVLKIVKEADRLVERCDTRDPMRLVDDLGITVLERPFTVQRGAYKIVLRQPFIFLKQDLDPVMKQIVVCHEIGHHALHRNEAVNAGGFREFELFNMTGKRMEYEANIFAAQVSLPDDEVLEYVCQGFDIEQVAGAMRSDINLVALKIATLRLQGYDFRPQGYRSDFLKYDRS